jgi:hypothetical protein
MKSTKPKLRRSEMKVNMPPRWGFSSFWMNGYKDVAPPELRNRSLVGLFFVVVMLVLASAVRLVGAELRYAPAPIWNPLKGFIAGGSSRQDFPHSLEFSSFSLASLMKDQDTFDWTHLDNYLRAVANRGNQAIFRVYTDWPGRPSGWPPFLIAAGADHHVITNRLPNRVLGEVIINPNDPRAQSALTDFILALGKRYDGDARIAFIQAGLLGAWGEWLSWSHPTTQGRLEFTPKEAVQRTVLDAYATAFAKTKVQVRFPDPKHLDSPFGYHDEWFAREGLRVAYEKAGPPSREKWRAQPIGGRFHPLFRDCLWKGPDACGMSVEDVLLQIEINHMSYLRLPGSFAEIKPEAADYAAAWAHRLGYELHVPRASVASTRVGEPLRVSVTMTNTGVAPFYYPWKVELAAFAGGQLAAMWTTAWDITRVIPGLPQREYDHAVAKHDLDAGTYELLLHVINPLTHGHPLRFANETQDRHQPGWLSIGSFEVEQ